LSFLDFFAFLSLVVRWNLRHTVTAPMRCAVIREVTARKAVFSFSQKEPNVPRTAMPHQCLQVIVAVPSSSCDKAHSIGRICRNALASFMYHRSIFLSVL
jgi:hypothetical protein